MSSRRSSCPDSNFAAVNLILVESAELRCDGAVTLSGARAVHLIDVLKVTPGSRVRVGVVDGPIGEARTVAVEKDRVTLQCALSGPAPARPPVDLLLALPRPKVMRRLWAQLAALGVGRIMLTNAERVERHYFDTHVLGEACYRPLLVEGLQQARDTRLPLVSMHKQFRKLVEDELDGLSDATVRLVAHPGRDRALADSIDRSAGRVLIAIGPEGGWNEFEIGLLEARGFERISMGPRPLRCDTATVALLALVHEGVRS